MADEPSDEYVSFTIHGVRRRDVEQFDDLGARLVSGRGDLMKVRKDAFYFSLFFLRMIDDVASRVAERQKEDLKKELVLEMKKELALAMARGLETPPCKDQ